MGVCYHVAIGDHFAASVLFIIVISIIMDVKIIVGNVTNTASIDRGQMLQVKILGSLMIVRCFIFFFLTAMVLKMDVEIVVPSRFLTYARLMIRFEEITPQKSKGHRSVFVARLSVCVDQW